MKPLEELGISPAPWKVTSDIVIHVISANGEQVADDRGMSASDVAVLMANARLIAAAPELYKCLRECLSILHMVVNTVGGADAETLQTMVKSQRALEKAGGAE